MKKNIFLILVMALFIMGIPSYAACSHQYVKECNYSEELPKLLNNHYYRMKCSLCNDIEISKTQSLEACTYENGVCKLCGVEQKFVPTYDIGLTPELQSFLYKKCIAYDVEEAYEYLIVAMYRQSNFNDKLEQGLNKGLFQLDSAYNYSFLIGRSNYDLLDAKDNIEIGIALFEYYYNLNSQGKCTATLMLLTGCASDEVMEYTSAEICVSEDSFAGKLETSVSNLKYNKVLE